MRCTEVCWPAWHEIVQCAQSHDDGPTASMQLAPMRGQRYNWLKMSSPIVHAGRCMQSLKSLPCSRVTNVTTAAYHLTSCTLHLCCHFLLAACSSDSSTCSGGRSLVAGRVKSSDLQANSRLCQPPKAWQRVPRAMTASNCRCRGSTGQCRRQTRHRPLRAVLRSVLLGVLLPTSAMTLNPHVLPFSLCPCTQQIGVTNAHRAVGEMPLSKRKYTATSATPQ